MHERHAELSAAGDPLEGLAMVVDFELFSPELEAALDRSGRFKGGRPPYRVKALSVQRQRRKIGCAHAEQEPTIDNRTSTRPHDYV
jgi:hypothetical protein